MKVLKYLLLLLIVFAIALSLVACNDDNGGTPTVPGGNNDNPKTVWDRNEVNEKITVGLRNAGSGIANQTEGVRHVVSQYDLLVDIVNMTFYYEANYNLTRAEDSEILFRIFNNQFEANELFIYYKDGTLYYEINGNKSKIVGFGNTSNFDSFYRAMTAIDAGSYYFSEDFAYYVTNGVPITRNISIIPIGNNKESILFSDVNLNVAVIPVMDENNQPTTINIREYINGLIKDYYSLIGESFDALSQYLVGFDLSILNSVEIGVINLDELNIVNENQKTSTIKIDISGKQADNIGVFRFGFYYANADNGSAIHLKNTEDPDLMVEDLNAPDNQRPVNEYKATNLGQVHYKGEMYIPSLDIDEDHPFYIEIKADLTSADNAQNLLYIDIRDKTSENSQGSDYYINKSIGLICYENGTTYVDIEGLRDLYLGDGVALWQLLDVPGGSSPDDKLAFSLEGMDLSKQMGMFSDFFMSLLLGLDEEDEASIWGLFSYERLGTMLSFVGSEDSKIVFTLNNELLAELIGDDSANLIGWMAEELGISETIIESVVGTGVLDDVSLKIYFDTETEEIGITLLNGSTEVFRFSLFSQEIPVQGLDIDFPAEYFTNTYYGIKEPEVATLELNGKITKQGADPVDMSEFMGAFIGDVTGVNTPYSMTISDVLALKVNLWKIADQTYVKAFLSAGTKNTALEDYETVMELYTIVSETTESGIRVGDIYCDNRILDIKYAMSLEALMDSFEELLGEDNVFTVDGVMNVVNMLSSGANLTFGEDDISFRLAPYEKDGVNYDPVSELIGLESLIVDMSAKIRFLEGDSFDTPQGVFGAEFDETQYAAPVIAQLPSVRYNSIYEATWHDTVDVTFGSVTKSFRLSFLGDSAKLISNTYDYYPEAKLLGEIVSYMMILTDTQNGTKVISEIAISKLSINPIEENPIPKKISVLYDDGTYGELAFEIINFPYSDQTIATALQGLALKNYTIVIGQGSIAERNFVLPIEVLNRIIIPLELMDVTGEPYTHYGAVPIVATALIDPYDYMLKKRADASYNPVDPDEVFYLYFKALDESLGNTRINILDDPKYADFSWGFEESAISFRGGTYYAVVDYYSLQIAIQITVKTRIFDYVKVFVKDPDHGLIEELNGHYTIDALLQQSYEMPVTTNQRAEVRIYFKTGNYRVIGEGLGVETNDVCDGEFPYELSWNLTADNVDIDGTSVPLFGGTTNINKGVFSAESAVVKRFQQNISLIVNCPSRRLELLADAVRCEIDRDGNNNSVMGDIKINKIAFAYADVPADKDEDYGRFTYNPIAAASQSKLPAYVYIPVQYADAYLLRRYPVVWRESTLLDRNGNLRYPSADEIFVKAEGTIGTQTATIAIHNIKAPYKLDIPDPNADNAIITQEEDGVYVININPYDEYLLPNFVTVRYTDTGVHQTFHDVVWYIDNGQGGMTDIDDAYRFPYQGGDYVLYTYIQKDPVAGILAQTVPLMVRVESMILTLNDAGNYTANDLDVGLGCLSEGSGLRYVPIDTYTSNSLDLLHKLEDGVASLTLNFLDGEGDVISKSGMQVTWAEGSVEGVIEALKSPLGSSELTNGNIELKGAIFKGTNIEQSITFVYKIDAQEFGSINFENLDTYYTKTAQEITSNEILSDVSLYDVLTIDVDPVAKEIFVLLKKPYALKGAERNYALPSEYFSYLLDNISIIISGNAGSRQIPDCAAVYDILNSFDNTLLNFVSGSQITSADFLVTKLNAESSCEENFVFRVNAVYDKPLQQTLTTNVETLQEDGNAKTEYKAVGSGYTVEQSVSVTYLNSGVIRYLVDKWGITRDYIAYNLVEGEVKSNEGQSLTITGLENKSVTLIPNALFHSTKGNTITLNTTLPDGTLIYNEIRFLPKNINKTDYRAIADDSAYSIGVMGEGGALVLRDVYSVFPFDPSKLPKVITPNPSSEFNLLEDSAISFTVDKWTPSGFFNEDGTFSQTMLKALINSEGCSRTLLATAEINTTYPVTTCDENGNLTETQTIELYISAAQLYQYLLSHPRLPVSVNETERVVLDPNDDSKNFDKTLNYSIVVDPYDLDAQDRYSVVDGEEKFFFKLPLELQAEMYSRFLGQITVTTITHHFSAEDLSYQVMDIYGQWHNADALQYSYSGHRMGADFGSPTSTITVRAKLRDYMPLDEGELGQYFEFGVRFLNRTLDQAMPVKIQNFTNLQGADGLLWGKYYIDPYNEDTFVLPDEATFYFENGDTKVLDILWTAPSGSPFITTGATTSFLPSLSATFFEGGQYQFDSDLSQYGVDAQIYSVEVIVVNRALAEEYEETYNFDAINTLEGRASDIPNMLAEANFVPLAEDLLYYDYLQIAAPVIPVINWNIEDNEIDFVNGFHNKAVSGNLTFDSVTGESAQVTISGNKLRYSGITHKIDEDGIETPMTGLTIEFNSYTNSSADTAFRVNFEKIDFNGNSAGSVSIICYSRPYADTEEQKRAVIDWGDVTDTDEHAIRVFHICNLFKLDGEQDRIAVTGYKYSFGQMVIDEIDLGYGKAPSGLVEFVIDPVYPQIPDTVTAYGINTLTHRDVVIEDVMAVWDESVYTHTSLEGGQYQIGLTLYINGNPVALFEVIVYYLNRVAKNVYTRDPNFSTMGISEGYFKLLTTDPVSGIRTSYFEIDPIRDAIYDEPNKRYKLPTNLKVTYDYDFAEGSILYQGILKLGAETFYEDIDFEDWLMSGTIELAGTPEGEAITLKLNTYIFQYEISGTVSETVSVEISAENNRLDNSYNLTLTVINRAVAYTSISTIYESEEGLMYQLAGSEYEIDPYNPVFPKEIDIHFTGREEDPKIYAEGTFQWEYDEDYFEDEDVLSGNDPAKLFMWASMKVYGATLNIKFKIKPRYIEVPRYPNGGIIGIDGGTLYVLKDDNIRTALPTYMYYKFDNEGATEVAKVPLSFPSSELAKIDTSKAGTVYNGIKGKLGKIDDDNIKFNIVIIDPVIYNIETTTSTVGSISYSKGNFIFDLISVPCDQLGNYNSGQEYLLMPRIVIVEENGSYLEIDHSSTVYDIDNQTATFYCKYYFRSTSDRLSGNANGYDEDSTKLSIVFTKTISPYNYNNVSEELYFTDQDGEPVTEYIMDVPLGQKVYSSQMPKAYDSRDNGYNLFWDFSDVNVNKAGDYEAIGYYRNQLETNVPLTIVVRVAKQKLGADDVRIDNFWLERRYLGQQLPLDDYLTLVDFLREDGSYGPVDYIIGYAFSENGPWISNQPIDVGTYYVRILINDYNVDDYKIFSFTIRVNEILENEIYYEDSSSEAETTYTYDNKGKIIGRSISYIYKGQEQRPWLVYTGGGVDILGNNLLQYTETCYKYNQLEDIWELYTGTIKNVGVYKLVMTIDNSQPNFYYSPENLPIEVTIRILRKTVYYSLVDSFVYTGDYVDVPVVIRDAYANELDKEQYQDLYDIVATSQYVYQQRTLSGWIDLSAGSKVISAGLYRVTVRIDGGINYNSANLLLPNGMPDSTCIVDELKEKQFTITKRQVDFRINYVTSYYLDDIMSFSSAATLNEPGAFGDQTEIVKSDINEIIAILGALDIVVGVNGVSSGATLTKYSIKGEYPLTLISRPSSETIANYEIMHYYDGVYEIATPSEAVLITSQEQLLDNIDALEDNSETPYKWYLSEGSYGSITIDKNVNLSIVGAYDENEMPVVVFESITITKGTVGLDIVRLNAIGNKALISLGENAGTFTVSRSCLMRTGSSYLTNSVALYSEMGYQNTIYLNNTVITGFTAGVLMMGGSVNMRECTLDNNISALQVRNGDLELHQNTFSYNKSEAVYIAGANVAYTFNNNSFVANVVGIKTTVAISNEVYNRNSFLNNAKNIQKL